MSLSELLVDFSVETNHARKVERLRLRLDHVAVPPIKYVGARKIEGSVVLGLHQMGKIGKLLIDKRDRVASVCNPHSLYSINSEVVFNPHKPVVQLVYVITPDQPADPVIAGALGVKATLARDRLEATPTDLYRVFKPVVTQDSYVFSTNTFGTGFSEMSTATRLVPMSPRHSSVGCLCCKEGSCWWCTDKVYIEPSPRDAVVITGFPEVIDIKATTGGKRKNIMMSRNEHELLFNPDILFEYNCIIHTELKPLFKINRKHAYPTEIVRVVYEQIKLDRGEDPRCWGVIPMSRPGSTTSWGDCESEFPKMVKTRLREYLIGTLCWGAVSTKALTQIYNRLSYNIIKRMNITPRLVSKTIVRVFEKYGRATFSGLCDPVVIKIDRTLEYAVVLNDALGTEQCVVYKKMT